MEEKKDAKQSGGKARRAPVFLTEADLKAAARNPEGGYFLYGDEDYLKSHYAASIRAAALEDSTVPELNLSLFDEDNYTPAALEDAIATLPMMGPRRFVMLRLSDVSGMKEEERKKLVEALSSLREYPETVFVLVADAGGFEGGKPNAPSAHEYAFSTVLKLAPVPLQSEAKLLRWLGRHVADHSLTAEPAALTELIRRCGREMYRLSSETEKACMLAKSRGETALTVGTVREATVQTPEETAFMMANAVMRGDRDTALACLGRAVKRAEPPIRLLAGVTGVIADLAAAAQLVKDGDGPEAVAKKLKMHDYKAKLYVNAVRQVPRERLIRALALCAETDYKMKTTSSLGYAPLEMLVCTAADAARRDGAVWKK